MNNTNKDKIISISVVPGYKGEDGHYLKAGIVALTANGKVLEKNVGEDRWENATPISLEDI